MNTKLLLLALLLSLSCCSSFAQQPRDLPTAEEDTSYNATAIDLSIAAASASNSPSTENAPLTSEQQTVPLPSENAFQNVGAAIGSYEERPMNVSSSVIDLACTNAYLNPYFQNAYIGVSPIQYQKGFTCGRCVELECNDQTCTYNNNTVIAMVVDLCGECMDNDITLFGPLFSKLAGRDVQPNPKISISWQFTDCSPYINTSIKMLVKPNGSPYYQAFNFANSRVPITAVQVNGQRLKHENNNYWSWNPTSGPINPSSGAFNFALLGENGQVLRFRVGVLRSQDTKVQFALMPVPSMVVNNNTASSSSGSSGSSNTSSVATDGGVAAVDPPLAVPSSSNSTTTIALAPSSTVLLNNNNNNQSSIKD